MPFNLKEFGKRLQVARINKDLTQEELAHMLGVSSTYLSRIECGKVNPKITLLMEICETLEASPAYILTGQDEDLEKYLSAELSKSMEKCNPERRRAILRLDKIIADLH